MKHLGVCIFFIKKWIYAFLVNKRAPQNNASSQYSIVWLKIIRLRLWNKTKVKRCQLFFCANAVLCTCGAQLSGARVNLGIHHELDTKLDTWVCEVRTANEDNRAFQDVIFSYLFKITSWTSLGQTASLTCALENNSSSARPICVRWHSWSAIINIFARSMCSRNNV